MENSEYKNDSIMTVNFNREFIDCFGNGIPGKNPEKVSNMAEELCLTLFNLSTLGGGIVSPDKKYMAYRLSLRISECPDAVELTTEEASFLKEVSAEAYSAGAYGRVADLIEGK